MKCPSEVELNEFAEDRLESRRRWEIQSHLDQCTGCRTDLEGLQWGGDQLAVLDVVAEAEAMEHPSDADLAALAEGAVDADRKAELLSHVGACAECARLFGALPRPQRKALIPRSLFAFAAAAALILVIGVVAFTGHFARHARVSPSTVAMNAGTETHKFASKPPVAKTTKSEKPAAKPTQLALAPPPPVVRPAPKPVVKATPKPVTPPAAAPKVVAQATPAPKPIIAASAAGLAPHPAAHHIPAVRNHGGRATPVGRGGHVGHTGSRGPANYNNMQLAMRGPQDAMKSFGGRRAAATRDGALPAGKHVTTPRHPAQAEAYVPPAPGESMAAVTAPGAPGAGRGFSPAAAVPGQRVVVNVQPTPGPRPQTAPAAVTQRSQNLSQRMRQASNDPAKKARLKAARRRHLAAAKAAGQRARAEVLRNKAIKAALKAEAAKSSLRHAPGHAKVAGLHHHGGSAAVRLAHAHLPTGHPNA